MLSCLLQAALDAVAYDEQITDQRFSSSPQLKTACIPTLGNPHCQEMECTVRMVAQLNLTSLVTACTHDHAVFVLRVDLAALLDRSAYQRYSVDRAMQSGSSIGRKVLPTSSCDSDVWNGLIHHSCDDRAHRSSISANPLYAPALLRMRKICHDFFSDASEKV